MLSGGAEALELGVVMSMMAATSSGSEKRASGGGEVLRGCRQPSGRQRHWPVMGAERRVGEAASEELPVATALPWIELGFKSVGADGCGGEP